MRDRGRPEGADGIASCGTGETRCQTPHQAPNNPGRCALHGGHACLRAVVFSRCFVVVVEKSVSRVWWDRHSSSVSSRVAVCVVQTRLGVDDGSRRAQECVNPFAALQAHSSLAATPASTVTRSGTWSSCHREILFCSIGFTRMLGLEARWQPSREHCSGARPCQRGHSGCTRGMCICAITGTNVAARFPLRWWPIRIFGRVLGVLVYMRVNSRAVCKPPSIFPIDTRR